MKVILGRKAFTDNVVGGSYAINSKDVFTSWTDANGITHREVIRQQVTGSFNLAFQTMDEYNDFVSYIQRSFEDDNYLQCEMTVNNTGEDKEFNAYITFTPSRDIGVGWRDVIYQITVKVEEK